MIKQNNIFTMNGTVIEKINSHINYYNKYRVLRKIN